MRWLRFTLTASAVVALAGLGALNWRAQIRTQQKLDALTAAVANRPAAQAPVEAVAPPPQVQIPQPGRVPRELEKVPLPPYVIETPDILVIEACLRDAGTGKVARLSEDAITGRHLVRPDGTVNLGAWGSVGVSGLTTDQAADAVRKQLVKYFEKRPADSIIVTVDVHSFNSKVYYVISDAAGGGEQVARVPLTGNETILDAITNAGGLAGPGKRKMWVARQTTSGQPGQTLPVDYAAITQLGDTTTNYQLLPGDRLYIKRAAE